MCSPHINTRKILIHKNVHNIRSCTVEINGRVAPVAKGWGMGDGGCRREVAAVVIAHVLRSKRNPNT